MGQVETKTSLRVPKQRFATSPGRLRVELFVCPASTHCPPCLVKQQRDGNAMVPRRSPLDDQAVRYQPPSERRHRHRWREPRSVVFWHATSVFSIENSIQNPHGHYAVETSRKNSTPRRRHLEASSGWSLPGLVHDAPIHLKPRGGEQGRNEYTAQFRKRLTRKV